MATNFGKYVATQVLDAGLPSTSLSTFLAALSIGDQVAIAKIPGVTDHILGIAAKAAHVAYLKAFQVVYYTSLAFGLVGLIAALCLSPHGLDRKLTAEVSRKLHGATADKVPAQDDEREKGI